MSLFEVYVCRTVYAACSYAVWAIVPQPVQVPEPAEIARICSEVAYADQFGELVSHEVGPLLLHSGKFGPQIFLRGESVLYGYVTHHDPQIAEHCVRMIRGVFGG